MLVYCLEESLEKKARGLQRDSFELVLCDSMCHQCQLPTCAPFNIIQHWQDEERAPSKEEMKVKREKSNSSNATENEEVKCQRLGGIGSADPL